MPTYHHVKNRHSFYTLARLPSTCGEKFRASPPSSCVGDHRALFRIRFSIPVRVPDGGKGVDEGGLNQVVKKIFIPLCNLLKKRGRYKRAHELQLCLCASVSSPAFVEVSKKVRKFSDLAGLRDEISSCLARPSLSWSTIEYIILSLAPLEEAGGCDGREHRRKLLNSKVVSPKSRNNNCLINCIIIATGTRFMKGYQINFLRNKLKIPHKAKIPWNSDWVQKICNFFRVQLEIYSRANELLITYIPQVSDDISDQALELKIKAEGYNYEAQEAENDLREEDEEDEEQEDGEQLSCEKKEHSCEKENGETLERHGLSIPRSSERQNVKVLLYEEHYYLITDMIYTKKKCSGCGGVYIKKHKCTLKPSPSLQSSPFSLLETSSSEVDDRHSIHTPTEENTTHDKRKLNLNGPETETCHSPYPQAKRARSLPEESIRLPGIDSFPDVDVGFLSPIQPMMRLPNSFPMTPVSNQHGTTLNNSSLALRQPEQMTLDHRVPHLPSFRAKSSPATSTSNQPIAFREPPTFHEGPSARVVENNMGYNLSRFYPSTPIPNHPPQINTQFEYQIHSRPPSDDKMSFSTTSNQHIYSTNYPFPSPVMSRTFLGHLKVFPS